MRFCHKHLERIPSKFNQEEVNQIISNFITKMIDPIELQDKVDRRKNQCPVCFFGKRATIYLKFLIKEKNKVTA